MSFRSTDYSNGTASAVGRAADRSFPRRASQTADAMDTEALRSQISLIRDDLKGNLDNSQATVNNSGTFLDELEDYHSMMSSASSTHTTKSMASPKNSSISSAAINKLEEQIAELTDKRSGLTGAPKGNAAKQIFGLQSKLIKEIAKEKGWSVASPAALNAKDKFLNAFQAVVSECEYCNSNPAEFKSREKNEVANVLEALQDSMNKDFLSLVGTDAGDDLLKQVTSMASGLTQANKNYINTYTGVQSILWGNYSNELGPKPKAS